MQSPRTCDHLEQKIFLQYFKPVCWRLIVDPKYTKDRIVYISLLIYHLQQWLNGELHVSHSTLVSTSHHWLCVPLAATLSSKPNVIRKSVLLCNNDCEKNHIIYKLIQGLKQFCYVVYFGTVLLGVVPAYVIDTMQLTI